jgi:hypothetical protein
VGGLPLPFRVIADARAEDGGLRQSCRYCAELDGSFGRHRGMPHLRSQLVLRSGLSPHASAG